MEVDGRVLSHVGLPEDDVALLKKIAADLPLLADISRADILLWCRNGKHRAIVAVQARPRSVSPLYEAGRMGARVGEQEQPEIARALFQGQPQRQVRTIFVRGATVARQILQVHNPAGAVIAVLTVDSYWLAYERHRRRAKSFQDALRALQEMVLRGELRSAETLTPFGEHDGIVFISADRRVQYMSGVAASLYRSLGYRDSLVGRRITELDTMDAPLVAQALAERRCLERQDEQRGLTWVRRALPLFMPDGRLRARVAARWLKRVRPSRPYGALILVHDATEALKTQRALESQLAMLREVHHRVKNNLQIIASLTRMQARRAPEAARVILEECVNRILSVAVVHEFLSQNAKGSINLKDIATRIVGQTQQGLIDPTKRIQLKVRGPDIWLPAERATHCALVINELVQNAIEHGMAHRNEGTVDVELDDHGETVSIIVSDDGEGLPEGFDLVASSNLGLRIVRSMVERDLRGQIELRREQGTRAIVRFDKSVLGGN